MTIRDVTAAVAALLVVVSAAAAQPSAGAGAALPAVALPPELDRVLRDYERAWQAGDGPALARLFVDDGFAVQSGSAIARGHAAIARNITRPGGALQLTAYAFDVAGATGHVVGGYRYPARGGPGGRFVLVLRQAPGGRWLIVADLDNAGPRATPPPLDDRRVLAALNDDYVRSVLTSDVARFEQLLAADFRNTNPDGSILDRAGFLAQVGRPSQLRSLVADEVEIRVAGDTAIVHARTTYTTADGRPGAGRYTDVWQRQADGRWQAVAAHVTRLVR